MNPARPCALEPAWARPGTARCAKRCTFRRWLPFVSTRLSRCHRAVRIGARSDIPRAVISVLEIGEGRAGAVFVQDLGGSAGVVEGRDDRAGIAAGLAGLAVRGVIRKRRGLRTRVDNLGQSVPEVAILVESWSICSEMSWSK